MKQCGGQAIAWRLAALSLAAWLSATAGCGLARPGSTAGTRLLEAAAPATGDPTVTPTQARAAGPRADRPPRASTPLTISAAPPPAEPSDPPAVASSVTIGAMDATAAQDLRAAVGEPRADDDAPGVLAREVVDAKVGEINGRPVRLEEVLEDLRLGPQLAATAKEYQDKRRPRSQWVDSSRRLIRTQLQDLLRDELLTAEGRAQLTEPQKQGLRAFLLETQEDLRRVTGGGSRVQAQQRLQEQGLTERDVVNDQERRLLIDFELQQRVRNRVRVSWRDVRLYYERNVERFNPPPVAVLRLIRVAGDKPEAAQAIRERLARGEPFAAIAADRLNTFNADNAGLLPEQRLTRPLAETDLFPTTGRFAPLNAPARALSPGGTIGPVELPDPRGGTTDLAWVHLAELRELRRPLSDKDVQLEIIEQLTADRRARELDLYFERLLDRASFTSMDEMVDRLMELAGERYWPRG